MRRPKPITLVVVIALLLLVEILALFFFHIVRRETLISGVLALAGMFATVAALALLVRQWHGFAWPFSYEPNAATPVPRRRTETGFAIIAGQIDSYLRNWSRPDELKPLLVDLTRDRLAQHHGIALDDEARARPILGDDLADYVYSPPTKTMHHRNEQRLTRLITRIEEL